MDLRERLRARAEAASRSTQEDDPWLVIDDADNEQEDRPRSPIRGPRSPIRAPRSFHRGINTPFKPTRRGGKKSKKSDWRPGIEAAIPETSMCLIEGCDKSDGHVMARCQVYLDLSVEERVNLVESSRNCVMCLGYGHPSQQCPNARPCPVDNCSLPHHPSLHMKAQKSAFQRLAPPPPDKDFEPVDWDDLSQDDLRQDLMRKKSPLSPPRGRAERRYPPLVGYDNPDYLPLRSRSPQFGGFTPSPPRPLSPAFSPRRENSPPPRRNSPRMLSPRRFSPPPQRRFSPHRQGFSPLPPTRDSRWEFSPRRVSPRVSPTRLSPQARAGSPWRFSPRRVSPRGFSHRRESYRGVSPTQRRVSPLQRRNSLARISPPSRRISPPPRRTSPPLRRTSPPPRKTPPPLRRTSPPQPRSISPPPRRASPSPRRDDIFGTPPRKLCLPTPTPASAPISSSRSSPPRLSGVAAGQEDMDIDAPEPPPFPTWQSVSKERPSDIGKKKKRKADKSTIPTCMACGVGNHTVTQCKVFRLMTSAQRWTYVEQNSACVKCLNVNLQDNTCQACEKRKKDIKCGFNGCEEPHNHLLHFSKEENVPCNVCVCCGTSKHTKLADCPDFVSRTVAKRVELISMFPDICINCLEGEHSVASCPKEATCNMDGCTMRHHPYLHGIQDMEAGATITSCGACGALGTHLTYAECPMFLNMVLIKRMELVKGPPKVCKSCLKETDHEDCFKVMPCLVEGCIKLHHPLLHDPTAEGANRANKTKDKPVTCFSCGSKRHIAFKCSQFEGLAVHKRWEKFNAFLDGEDTAACCAICLRIGHHDKECLDSKRCGIRGCKDMHHPMLHHDYKTRDKPESGERFVTSEERLDNFLREQRGPPRPVRTITCHYCNEDGHHIRDCPVKPVCIMERCRGSQHGTERCTLFKSLQVWKRWQIVEAPKTGKVNCAQCLRPGHTSRECTDTRKCGIEGCTDMHHPLLHGSSTAPPKRAYPVETVEDTDESALVLGHFVKKTKDKLVICINCNFSGHKIEECPEPLRPELVRSCPVCKQEGHAATDCPQKQPANIKDCTAKESAPVIICNYCKEPGHHIKDCPVKEAKVITCNYCKEPGHHIRDCPTKEVIICSYCKQPGHHIKDCTTREQMICGNCLGQGHSRNQCPNGTRTNTGTIREGSSQEVNRNCYNCLKYGHSIKSCPELNKNSNNGGGKSMTNQVTCFKCLTVGHHISQCPKNFCERCKVQGHPLAECPAPPQRPLMSIQTCPPTTSVDYGHAKKSAPPPSNGAPQMLVPKPRMSMLEFFCTSLAKRGKSTALAQEMVNTWSLVRHDENTLHGWINSLSPRPKSKVELRLKIINLLQDAKVSKQMPFDVNVSELLDETVNYFWDEDAMKFLSLNLGSFGAAPGPPAAAVTQVGIPAPNYGPPPPPPPAANVTRSSIQGQYVGQNETASQRYGTGGHYGTPPAQFGSSSNQNTGPPGIATLTSTTSRQPMDQYRLSSGHTTSQPSERNFGMSTGQTSNQSGRQRGSTGQQQQATSQYATVADQWDEMMKAVTAAPAAKNIGLFAHRLEDSAAGTPQQQQTGQKRPSNTVSDSRFKQLDAIIDVGIKTDPDGFEGRLESFKPLQTFIQVKMASMQTEYGVSDAYIQSVASVIPRLLAHMDMSYFEMKSQLSLYGAHSVADSITDKLKQYQGTFPTGVTVNYIVSMISDFLKE